MGDPAPGPACNTLRAEFVDHEEIAIANSMIGLLDNGQTCL